MPTFTHLVASTSAEQSSLQVAQRHRLACAPPLSLSFWHILETMLLKDNWTISGISVCLFEVCCEKKQLQLFQNDVATFRTN